jgi:hypothetical protein
MFWERSVRPLVDQSRKRCIQKVEDIAAHFLSAAICDLVPGRFLNLFPKFQSISFAQTYSIAPEKKRRLFLDTGTLRNAGTAYAYQPSHALACVSAYAYG